LKMLGVKRPHTIRTIRKMYLYKIDLKR